MDPRAPELPEDGRRRVVVSAVHPSVEGGRCPVKRTLGDRLEVGADLLVDGHDRVAGLVRVQPPGGGEARELALRPAGVEHPDRFVAELALDRLGTWELTFEAWVDHFASFRHNLERKVGAGQDVSVELLSGAELCRAAAARARGTLDERPLAEAAARLADKRAAHTERSPLALAPELLAAAARHPDRSLAVR